MGPPKIKWSNRESPQPINTRAKNCLFHFTTRSFPHPKTTPLLPDKNSVLLFMPYLLHLERLCLSFDCSNLPCLLRQPKSHLLHDVIFSYWAPEFPLNLKAGLWVAWSNSVWVQICNSAKTGPKSFGATMSLVEPSTALAAKEALDLNIIALHCIELIWVD